MLACCHSARAGRNAAVQVVHQLELGVLERIRRRAWASQILITLTQTFQQQGTQVDHTSIDLRKSLQQLEDIRNLGPAHAIDADSFHHNMSGSQEEGRVGSSDYTGSSSNVKDAESVAIEVDEGVKLVSASAESAKANRRRIKAEREEREQRDEAEAQAKAEAEARAKAKADVKSSK
ncbi:unnamed protein product [Zymoseptoria tritici ST99CH_3D1]|nr:unnamed protein product [Zymoseptoria tritici ST99CH_3D1]